MLYDRPVYRLAGDGITPGIMSSVLLTDRVLPVKHAGIEQAVE